MARNEDAICNHSLVKCPATGRSASACLDQTHAACPQLSASPSDAPVVKVTPETFPVGTRVVAESTYMRRRITGTVTFWEGEIISVRWDSGFTTATVAGEGGLTYC